MTFLDVGANNGHIGIGLLRVSAVERVVAIEPEPLNASLLERNIAQNGIAGKVKFMNVAAAAERGTLRLALHDWNLGDHQVAVKPGENTVVVPAMPLDELTEQVSMMWIDVQGSEGFVFKGAQRLLLNGLPTVSEISPLGHRAQRAVAE